MCGIVGAYQLDTIGDLAVQMKERGTRVWSLCQVDLDSHTIAYEHHGEHAISVESISALPLPEIANPYYIVHVQSPTARSYRFHPATNQYGALWHNGMLESYELRRLQQSTMPLWDTELILDILSEHGETSQPQFEQLEKFQGSFACYYLEYGKGLYVFRNMISPQFFSVNDKTFCSIKFPECERVPVGDVINMITGEVIEQFRNEVNPFGVAG
ncbi:MAG: hypothetical protein LC687_03490 [Actinobacteria bacterium]|nr:hypothetical protein [Actinomycetota bacterium]